MEIRGVINGITVYDDFAHHPTAIATTLGGLRKRVGNQRIIAVLEPRSNTMRMGIHKETLAPSLALADQVILYQPSDLGWDLQSVADSIGNHTFLCNDVSAIINHIVRMARNGDHILIMSNGAFGGLHERLISELRHLPKETDLEN